jgi:hypothetical protein
VNAHTMPTLLALHAQATWTLVRAALSQDLVDGTCLQLFALCFDFLQTCLLPTRLFRCQSCQSLHLLIEFLHKARSSPMPTWTKQKLSARLTAEDGQIGDSTGADGETEAEYSQLL